MSLVYRAIETKDYGVSKLNKTTQHKSSVLHSYDDFYTKCEFESLEVSFEFYESPFENYNSIETFYDQYLGSQLETTENSSYNDETGVELFQALPIEHWDGEDCCDWAISVCRHRGLDSSKVNLWNFQNTTGSSMLQFSLQHFCLVAGNLHGSAFYQEFQTIKRKKKGSKIHQYQNEEEEENQCTWSPGEYDDNILSSSLPTFLSSSLPSSSSSSSFSSSSSVSSSDSDSWELSQEEFEDLDRYIPLNEVWNDLPEDLLDMDLKDYRNSEEENTENSDAEESTQTKKLSKKSRKNREVFTRKGPTQKIKTKTRKGERNPKIWEFLMRLLVDETTNPELIRWHEKTKTTFVLTKPAAIAQLWGARANKPNLSANNFARALRYHYSTGGLVAVSEKHYMYKCGPKSLRYLLELQRDSSSSDDDV